MKTKTDAEKIAAFDNLHTMTQQYFDGVMEAKAYPVDDDSRHYIYEAAMEQTLGMDCFQRMGQVIQKAADARRKAQEKLDRKYGR